jgi:hypothetical protein
MACVLNRAERDFDYRFAEIKADNSDAHFSGSGIDGTDLKRRSEPEPMSRHR